MQPTTITSEFKFIIWKKIIFREATIQQFVLNFPKKVWNFDQKIDWSINFRQFRILFPEGLQIWLLWNQLEESVLLYSDTKVDIELI